MKTAFVTGSAGFLGLNLIEELNRRAWDIIALHLPDENLKYISRFTVHPIAANILSMNSLLESIPEKVDVVFHMAGDISTWSKNNDRQSRINIDGTKNMLDASIRRKAKRFIYTSSISAFGFHEGPVSEETISNAMGSGVNYHKTKYLAEQEVKKRSEEVDTIILNPCSIIGPYDKIGWAQAIIAVYQNRAYAIPPGIGTFAHVNDIVCAHIAASEIPAPRQQYVLGGIQASFKEVFNTIEKIMGKPISSKVISKSELKIVMYRLMLKSFFNKKEPIFTPEKYKELIGKQIIDDRRAMMDLNLRKTSLEKMVTDSYKWLLKENILTDRLRR